MELKVVGCHGGETPKHRTSAFVLDGTLAIDAGSLTSGLDVKAQCRLDACLVSHAHLDHIRDLATLSDNRCQNRCPPLVVAASRTTIDILRRHFFNDLLWPDFSRIPSAAEPTIRFLELPAETPVEVAGRIVRAVPVDHTIDSSAFILESPRERDSLGTRAKPSARGGRLSRRAGAGRGRARVDGGAIAYSGDTGPTERLWHLLGEVADLRALLMEVSFPNEEQRVATISGHHTPNTLAAELKKLPNARQIPIFLYHIKPTFQRIVERECARIRGADLTVLKLGDEFVL